MKSMLKSLMSVAVAALAFTSCSNDATEDVMPNGGLKTLEVNATIDQTRTVMTDNHVNLDWATGDKIHLYIGDQATEAQAIHHTIGDKLTATYDNGNTVYAYYSTGSDKSQGVKKVRLNIPGEQTQTKADVFAGENMPMAAKGTIAKGKVDLAFQPLACVLVFNVYGPAAENEKIQSIKFAAAGCSGYYSNGCDLTADPVKYIAYDYSSSATVKLTEGAPIANAKPTEDTHRGSGNQVYLVVAPVKYPAGSKFTVTTDATDNNTYTFTTTTELDCSANTARVVNLNLAKSAEIKPAIEVPDVPRQESAGNDNLTISPITFKNITNEQIAAAQIGVYSDKDLTQTLENPWITIDNSNATNLSAGQLKCIVAENTTAERTAYIGIKCVEGTQVIAQAAIAIKQVAAGAVIPDPITAEVSKIVTESGYKEYTTVDWIVTYGGGHTNTSIPSLGSSNTNNAKNCYLTKYPALAEAMGFTSPYNDSTDKKAAAIMSVKALPAGYNTVTVEYDDVRPSDLTVGVAFSTNDGATWTRIMDFTPLNKAENAGSQTYTFPQQEEAGRYAFVAKSKVTNSRITNCKITYSQE